MRKELDALAAMQKYLNRDDKTLSSRRRISTGSFRIDSEKLGRFDSLRVYGAWRFGGVWDGTGGFGLLVLIK